MFYIQIIGVIFVLGYYFGRRNARQNDTKYDELHKKIQIELKKTKNNHVKEALSKILGLPTAWQQTDNQDLLSQPEETKSATIQPQQLAESSPAPQVILENPTNIDYEETPEPRTDFAFKDYVDNTSLLLYFGAFLFISSVGLFVAFGNVEGVLRTASVALVSIIMYCLGFYLWNTKKKLKQVGEAFIGIGMMAIPFVGITAYNNSLDQSNAASIWVITSLIALVMYAITIVYMRTTFVSYLLIGSVVSLTQSFVGITEGPVYYFIWVLAFTGIIMQFLSIVSQKVTPLRDASSISGQIFIPVAILASVLVSTTQGIGQLAMTAGLATLYYGLLAITDKEYRQNYISLTHVLAIVTTLLTTYAISESFLYLANALVIISIIHIFVILAYKKYLSEDIVHQNIALTSAMFIVVLSLVEYEPLSIVIGIFIFFILSALISYVFKYLYSLFLSLGSWIALSYAIGQLLPSQSLNGFDQAILSTIFVIPLIVILALNKFGPNELWRETVRNFLLSGLIIALAVSLSSTPYQILTLSLWLFIIATVASEISVDKNDSCRYVSLLFAGTPVIFAILTQTYLSDPGYFSIATLILLLINIIMALVYKFEFSRWLSTASWLLLPIALMSDKVFSLSWSPSNILWLYSVVVLVLSISRAIARGKILPNYNIPLASMAKSSSQSYFLGMLLASGVVYITSFANIYGSVFSAIYILTLTGYLTWHFKIIEKSNYFAALLPLFAQLALIRLIEPYNATNNSLQLDKNIIFPLLSSTIALVFYFYNAFIGIESDEKNSLSRDDFLKVSLVALFIAPLSFIFNGDISWAMPVTLMVGGVALLHYNKNNTQASKEAIGGLIFFGLVWLLNYSGIDNLQVYTHLLAALFALYAYIRYTLNDENTSDQYLYAMLGTSTVPLILQSLNSGSGEFLGIWLLLEQVGFLLLGILIQKPFVTKWGLYVAIGAVLYQLRDLGWAMLAVLSLFIIGVAIYRALKQPDDK